MITCGGWSIGAYIGHGGGRGGRAAAELLIVQEHLLVQLQREFRVAATIYASLVFSVTTDENYVRFAVCARAVHSFNAYFEARALRVSIYHLSRTQPHLLEVAKIIYDKHQFHKVTCNGSVHHREYLITCAHSEFQIAEHFLNVVWDPMQITDVLENNLCLQWKWRIVWCRRFAEDYYLSILFSRRTKHNKKIANHAVENIKCFKGFPGVFKVQVRTCVALSVSCAQY